MWYIDNETSNHICGDKNKFMELDDAVRGNVTFANHSKIIIKGKYMILIKLKDRSHQFIDYYISMLKGNILSLRQLLKKGYMNKMKDRILILFDTK